ncbi:FAD/FMN-containing dehydrogenase [Thermocatellispora tengchongensis]|uniref:FAD/FMN-containing dehydrogenase n=1 Tax=Thermocatellispora tengchongensis TaxID=1073253 RepID=A0A840NX25_9ACTN|nr:FAD-binding oxidoreductase [Thermocatellispora tengchongensis]MBB5131762.1 FAD/FMN-containing dehydrogenase [Thermocatellispora tengchongensis]
MSHNDGVLGDDLRRVVRGRVLVPGEEGFAAAATPWNVAVAQPVRAVVEVADADDAAKLVAFASGAGLAVTTQPTGHGATGDVEGAILVRPSRLRGVEVRPAERVVRFEAGMSWGEVLDEAGKHGLGALAGSSPVVGATGYLLGGGMSWFGRAHGVAANSVRAFEVVDADGERARVTAGSDPGLFFALRGGGGDFALVTAVELELFDAPELYGGRIMWPYAMAREVGEAFLEITRDAPEELSVWFALMHFPPSPNVPEPLRGLSVVVADAVHLGGEAEGRELLRRFEPIPGVILDTRTGRRMSELGDVCAEPVAPMPVKAAGRMLTRFDDLVLDRLLTAAGPQGVGPLNSVQIRHTGGALARTPAVPSAAGSFPEPYLCNNVGVLATPETARLVAARDAEIAAALAPYTGERRPLTFMEAGDTAAAAFSPETLARLREIKRARDPHGVFRGNFPVMG